jgi:hypothetical protein
MEIFDFRLGAISKLPCEVYTLYITFCQLFSFFLSIFSCYDYYSWNFLCDTYKLADIIIIVVVIIETYSYYVTFINLQIFVHKRIDHIGHSEKRRCRSDHDNFRPRLERSGESQSFQIQYFQYILVINIRLMDKIWCRRLFLSLVSPKIPNMYSVDHLNFFNF